jgi:hypothetical protein
MKMTIFELAESIFVSTARMTLVALRVKFTNLITNR